jgi:ankyrin repeat protein
MVDHAKYRSQKLIEAVRNNDIDTVIGNLPHAINVNITDKWGTTPLMIACSKNYKEIVRLLLSHKDINVNLENSSGATALSLVSSWNKTSLLRMLLDHPNIDVQYRNKYNQTAIQQTPHHHGKTIAMLRSKGA